MAHSVLHRASSQWIRQALKLTQNAGRTILYPKPVSQEYRRWRNRLIRKRFWLSVGLVVAWLVIAGSASFYEIFVHPEQLLNRLEQRNLAYLLEPLRQLFVLQQGVILGLLGLLILFRNSPWGRKYPALLVLLFPWAVSFIPKTVLSTFFGIPGYPDTIMFMAQVAILPVYWRLHFVAQAIPIAYYFFVNPLFGLSTAGGASIYSFPFTVELVLVCMVCEVGVYLYEQSKMSELEAHRRLQLCIHAITHDLRTPVMGSSMLLESIQQSTPATQPIHISQSEMSHLIGGCDRILDLMNTLLDNQALSQNELILDLQPTNLSSVISTVLSDFQPAFTKKDTHLNNRIQADLLTVHADAQQIWRVLCNLVSNAVHHNPPGLNLILDASVLHDSSRRRGSRPMLKITVQDDGVGITSAQRRTIFEPYTRNQQSQYQPGLGLGLYICRQIVVAHGGEIGIETPSQGTTLWFTLPLEPLG
ncbi:MAG: HAMP domain-containing sensor histidine kinase [Cyanobacteria bacterium P01_A01_bin.17]